MSDEIEIKDVPQVFQPGDKVLIPTWLNFRPTPRTRTMRSNGTSTTDTRMAVVERVLFSPLNTGPTIILVKLYNGALVAFPVTDLERWRLHDNCATCTCKELEPIIDDEDDEEED